MRTPGFLLLVTSTFAAGCGTSGDDMGGPPDAAMRADLSIAGPDGASAAPDLATVDAATPDQAIPSDAASPPDVAMSLDVAMMIDMAMMIDSAASPDLAHASDLALADLIVLPDFSNPDLAMADLLRPDLATPGSTDLALGPDLQQPDLQQPDLQQPDLQRPDLAIPPDLQMPDLNQGPIHTVTVGENGLSFSPSTLTIPHGDTVHWVWSSSGHTVTSGTAPNADNKFCSPNNQNCGAQQPTSNQGATFDFVFNAAGNFPYFCVPHSGAGMKGTIIVQ